MSAADDPCQAPRMACESCRRRAQLLSRLGGRIEARRMDVSRLTALLELDEPALLLALDAGEIDSPRPGASGDQIYEVLDEGRCMRAADAAQAWELCKHERSWPLAGGCVNGPGSVCGGDWGPPHSLFGRGDPSALAAISAGKAVVIAGTRNASDYGRAVARRLAVELSSAGLTVLGAFAEGIGMAALSSAADVAGGVIAVAAGAADVVRPASGRWLDLQLIQRGCVISEHPWGARPRRWCYAARTRMLAGMASAVVMVEAEDSAVDLSLAHFARLLGRPVGAVPGRINSSASAGCHDLIASGAKLVRSGEDVLDLAWQGSTDGAPAADDHDRSRLVGGASCAHAAGVPESGQQIPEGNLSCDGLLARALDCIGRGMDSVQGLLAAGFDHRQALTVLLELELLGLVTRGDGGRYISSGALKRP